MIGVLFLVPFSVSAQTGSSELEPPMDTLDLTQPDTVYLPIPGGITSSDSAKSSDSDSIRATVRIEEEVRNDSTRLRAMIDSVENTPDAIRDKNLAFDPRDWQPTDADKAQRAADIARSQDFDFIFPKGVTRIPLASIPLSSIGQSLGLVEDVSPKISYTLKRTAKVTVKIYTQSALPFITLVDEVQRPGEYRMVWDFLDTNERRAIPGSYFAEVLVDGNTLLLRKRIVVP